MIFFHPKNGTDIACVLSIVSPSVVELDFLVKLLHDQRLKTLYLQLIALNQFPTVVFNIRHCALSCLLKFLLHEGGVSKCISCLVSLFDGFLPLPRQNNIP